MTLIDYIVVLSGILFHLVIAGIYVASKNERFDLVRKLGYVVIALGVPVTITLFNYWAIGRPPKLLLYLAAIILYLLIELVLDFILKIEFRKKPAIHIPYIVVFYAACFGFIAIAFSISDFWGYAVSISFWILLGSLIYLLIGGKKPVSSNATPP
jgi:hypothetical protein